MLCKQKPSPAFWARSGEAAASAPRTVSDLSKRLSQLFTICVGLRGAAALVGFFGKGFRFATSAKRETLSWQLPFFTNFVCSWPFCDMATVADYGRFRLGSRHTCITNHARL